MRRVARGAAWVVLVATIAFVAFYVGLLIHRRVNPPAVPIDSHNHLAGYATGDAVLVNRPHIADIERDMILAVRVDGRIAVGRVDSIGRARGHVNFTLRGIRANEQVTVDDTDVLGRGDRVIPLAGWLLLAARIRAVQLVVGAAILATIGMLVFVGRTPLDYLDEDVEPFELEPSRVLALPAGPAVATGSTPMPYVGSPMSITPDDLRQVRFAQTRKGYDTEAVDRALDTVADSLDAMLAERQQLLERLRAAEAEIERYKGLESQLGQTLAMAEKSAEQVKADAQAEAQRILAEAQSQAQATPGAAPTAAAPARPDGTTVELLGEMRAIRSLLQAALQPGGPLHQRPPGQQ